MKMKQFKFGIRSAVLFLLPLLVGFSGCREIFDLPEERDYLGKNLNYSDKILEPILGRTTVMGGFNADNSTMPMTFEIVNARYGDGRPVTDLFQVRPTWVWTAAYDGLETSLEEINAKRKLEERPLFEIRPSGEFILWGSSSNELIAPRPADSSSLTQEIRFFDVKISNSGGDTILKDFQIIPWRERPYEPSNDMNYYTGGIARDPNDLKNPFKRDYIQPGIDNIVGATTNRQMVNNEEIKDLVAYIRPFEGGNGHNLRFRFIGPDSSAIHPASFNDTKWDRLVHGFNMEMTDEYVQYDVAYPIPLVDIRTAFSNGSSANVKFNYSRGAFGGGRSFSSFWLDFEIFREGDWEIVFHFRNDLPKFEDE
ncbi:uncharacterized protein DUF5007 [Anseongella ginsenosidimutans]|uniref:Uncharacterized protein DUF5007 n=1 Tax=Anseongella ginsenosidimutans TaxID=496056 RepID=A0A4R3KKJ1_9SPHI|nr:DUF5007 domain-containing protein [Anseongella ginsenosidimutans]QEC54010.1 DUF5007 domain-containing protein [Anseongella ginsenosidimutans]TCS84284.1 uncharacterized protein DUF5007 [Anseongella ginsenosidimutans]